MKDKNEITTKDFNKKRSVVIWKQEDIPDDLSIIWQDGAEEQLDLYANHLLLIVLTPFRVEGGNGEYEEDDDDFFDFILERLGGEPVFLGVTTYPDDPPEWYLVHAVPIAVGEVKSFLRDKLMKPTEAHASIGRVESVTRYKGGKVVTEKKVDPLDADIIDA